MALKRDRFDRPLVIPRPGDEHLAIKSGPNKGLVPYDRASGFGSNLDDKSGLVKWQRRQVARGVTLLSRTGRLPATLPEPGDEPELGWEKDAWNDLADAAEAAVGSGLKAELGTSIHAATEAVDKGESLAGFHSFYQERADAYHRFITERGIKPTSVEVFGVEDEHRVAGTWDRTGYVDGVHCILDVKTSSSLAFGGLSFGVQLAVYAHASAYDPATGERTPHEVMDLERAWIIHVSRDAGGPVTLHPVDIATGWRYAGLVSQIKSARRAGKRIIGEAA